MCSRWKRESSIFRKLQRNYRSVSLFTGWFIIWSTKCVARRMMERVRRLRVVPEAGKQWGEVGGGGIHLLHKDGAWEHGGIHLLHQDGAWDHGGLHLLNKDESTLGTVTYACTVVGHLWHTPASPRWCMRAQLVGRRAQSCTDNCKRSCCFKIFGELSKSRVELWWSRRRRPCRSWDQRPGWLQ